MADRAVYIIGLNKFYLTNKTNITRLWEVVERELGNFELEISYQVSEHSCFKKIPARKHKIKQLCIDSYRNRILIHPVHINPHVDSTNCISVQQDLLGGRD